MVSKARNKELTKLRGNAQQLWLDQQALLDRASAVLKEARRQANFLTQEEVLPRARDAYATRVAPYVNRNSGRLAAESAVKAYTETLLPAVTSAATAAAALAASARGRLPGAGAAATTPQTASAAKKAKDTGKQAAKVAAAVAAAKAVSKAAPKGKAPAAPAKGGVGAGGLAGIAVASVAALGIGYAVWQTLRADDDLWVADDEPDLPPPGTEPTV